MNNIIMHLNNTQFTQNTTSVENNLLLLGASKRPYSLQEKIFAGFGATFSNLIPEMIVTATITGLLAPLFKELQINDGENKDMAKAYIEYCSKHPLEVCVLGPIVEELIYRGLLTQVAEVVTGVGRKLFFSSDKESEIDFFSIKVLPTKLIAILANSVLFGCAHLSNGNGAGQVISATLGGISYGLLNYEYGILAPIAAHMLNNTIISYPVLFIGCIYATISNLVAGSRKGNTFLKNHTFQTKKMT